MTGGDELVEFEILGYPRATVPQGAFQAARIAMDRHRQETRDRPPLLWTAQGCQPACVATLHARSIQVARAQHQPIHEGELGHRCTLVLPQGYARCPYMHRGRPNVVFGFYIHGRLMVCGEL